MRIAIFIGHQKEHNSIADTAETDKSELFSGRPNGSDS